PDAGDGGEGPRAGRSGRGRCARRHREDPRGAAARGQEVHASASPPACPAPSRPQEADERAVNGCTALEDRAIRNIGPRFSVLWKQMDAESISLMFTEMGDMRHPDGTIERGQQIIRANRQQLFNKKEYRGSSHPLTLNDI